MTGRGLLLTAFTLAASSYLLLVGVMWIFQRKLIYFPTTSRVPDAARFVEGGEDVVFVAEDGTRLAGWFVPGEGQVPAGGRRSPKASRDVGVKVKDKAESTRTQEPTETPTETKEPTETHERPETPERPPGTGATVLVFNGNGGHRALRAPLAEALSRAGLSVLLFDYRGYGGNPGIPSEAGLSADARAARRYLAGRRDVNPTRIIYFGESLGCAVAVGLAREQPPAAMVLRSPFTSLADVGRFHYPWLPIGLLLKDRYSSSKQIVSIACPLLVIAGSADRIIPAEQSRRLYDAAPGPKRFALIAGAGHNDDELLAGRTLVLEILRFLKEEARPGSVPQDGAS